MAHRPPSSTVYRNTARVLPINFDSKILLLHGWDPAAPESPFWFTIGGAGEPGEDLHSAGARELLEETGIVIDAADLGEPIAQHQHEFGWDGMVLIQDETYFAIRVGDIEVSLDGMDQIERGTTDQAQWWTPDDLDADGTAGFPQLISVMRAALELAAPLIP